ncbi:DUF2087 domain-containing protein [Marinicrinis sediminis]|uniref:DUF2087 domain-containing protein n=1 Tax=Marinicrinis sediminis TaxID=1652465 RepID=A0ABW5RDR9_9BACL
MRDEDKRFKESVLKNFFSSDGKLKRIPVQLKKKLIVLGFLVSKLEEGKSYKEREINDFIGNFHEDFATIRRECIVYALMSRDNQTYTVNPVEQWRNWETLS